MNKVGQIILWIVVIVVIVLIIWWVAGKKGPTEEGPIKIGAILPLTGDIANIGENTRAAIELALEEINGKGGIKGRTLEIIFEDGRCNAKEASSAANKLVNIDRTPVIIGGLCSSETLAAAPIVEEGKIVLLSPCSSSPDITDAGDYIFRNYPSDNFQGKRGAEIAYNDLGSKNVAILYCLSDWCVGLYEVFKARFTELGGTIAAKESFEQTSRDLRTQLTKIKNADPDLIYFLSYTEAAISALKQIKELNIATQILAAEVFDDPKIIEEVGDAAEGVLYTKPFAPLTDNFKAAMEVKTSGKDVTICTPQAYDAVHIIADILKKVGTDSDKIKDKLYKVSDYDGVSGVVGFDENGDLTSANYILKIVKDGKTVEYDL